MSTITIQEYGGRRQLRLNAFQKKHFEAELKHVRKYSPFAKEIPYRMSPDCTITVKQGTKKTEYGLYGRVILFEPKSKKQWRFYFGLLLLEWLYK